MGINFIFDEDLERSRNELQEIIDTLDEDVEIKRKSDILNKFTYAIILSLKKPELLKQQTKEEFLRPNLQQKPLKLLSRLFMRDIQPVVKKVPLKQVIIQEVKPVEKKPEIIQKDLILDKITNKVLAYVKLTDKYYLIEPMIDDNDTKVLNKVISKNPKNMEKGWKLISKYGDKFKVTSDHFTNIKYYVVNFLYGLGKIEPLIYDKDIQEIYCDGPTKPIKVKYNDKVIETNLAYLTKEDLDNFIYNLSYKVKQKIKKNNQKIIFNYRDLYFECTISFSPESTSSFLIKK